MTKQEELEAFRAARRDLLTGVAVTRVQTGGRLVEYRPADLDKLEAAIAQLEAETAAGGGSGRGAVGFRW